MPEAVVKSSVAGRILMASERYREHGYDQLPVLALALLDEARQRSNLLLVDKAVVLAPNSPAVRFEAARLAHSPMDLFAALWALMTRLPGLLWLLQLVGAMFCIGLALATSLMIVVALVRSAPQHTHALGHLGNSKDLPGLPGFVTILALLGLLPLAGFGPALVLAVAGAFAALRLSRREACGVGFALLVSGLCLGPLLDGWSRVAAIQEGNAHVLAAWRVERAQPLPGDLARLTAAHERSPDDILVRLALATLYEREGNLDRAIQILGRPPANANGSMLSAMFNLRGIIALAQGRAQDGIHEFQSARSAHESAAVLFNLSQAYGRALRLAEQQPLFSAARALDPGLISRVSSLDGRTIHDHLIHARLPLLTYLEEATSSDVSSNALAREMRMRALGPRFSDLGWIALPVLGILGVLLRRSDIGHCRRCSRAICAACETESNTRDTCVRCEALFGRSTIRDPRVHREQLRHERRRQKHELYGLALAGLLVPGTPEVYNGRLGAGFARLWFLAVAAFLLLMADLLPTPWDVGELGFWLPTGFGLLVLVPLYLNSVLRAVQSLAEARAI
ncbi:MAG: hypothetical protein GY725_03765 [bacterium]|nr:hypothetical protein [bacterium]